MTFKIRKSGYGRKNQQKGRNICGREKESAEAWKYLQKRERISRRAEISAEAGKNHRKGRNICRSGKESSEGQKYLRKRERISGRIEISAEDKQNLQKIITIIPILFFVVENQ
ncbi:hypothetical protein [Lentibacillus sp. CBA3610]|uniref:hypothetical protein n=1 Tax=Lentibacillus sp. CBA3610 TaxID=2518176 RepID=UPI00159554A4|nr:hypothetical protein [Lentibacillus sp. CBA3610]QKY68522.1 hypothetical protein Len3610_01840 [Lentibacillus sp. CBA3610]